MYNWIYIPRWKQQCLQKQQKTSQSFRLVWDLIFGFAQMLHPVFVTVNKHDAMLTFQCYVIKWMQERNKLKKKDQIQFRILHFNAKHCVKVFNLQILNGLSIKFLN